METVPIVHLCGLLISLTLPDFRFKREKSQKVSKIITLSNQLNLTDVRPCGVSAELKLVN